MGLDVNGNNKRIIRNKEKNFIGLILIAFALIFLIHFGTANAISKHNLYGYYTFNSGSTLFDQSQSVGSDDPSHINFTNNGSIVALGGIKNGAYDYTGSVYSYNNNGPFAFFSMAFQKVSFNVWFKSDNGFHNSAGKYMILSKISHDGGVNVFNGPQFDLQPVDVIHGRVAVELWHCCAADFTTYALQAYGQIPNDTNWHMLTFTMDSTYDPYAVFSLYVDGNPVYANNTAYVNFSNFVDSNPTWIGVCSSQVCGSGSYPLNAKLSELSIWQRQLNGHEVAELYSNGGGKSLLPILISTPQNGPVGTTVTLSGNNFTPSGIMKLKFDSSVLTTNPSTVTTNSTGGFSGVTFTVPSATGGLHTVNASDTSGKFATASFNVTSSVSIKFDNSTYAIESAGLITVNDPSATTTPITANVKSTTDSTGIPITLVRNGTSSQFVSQNYVRFSNSPSSSSSYILHASVNDIINATYTPSSGVKTSATATVTASRSPLVGTVVSSINPLGCVSGDHDQDGICDDWEDQTAHNGLRIPYGTAVYTLPCNPNATYNPNAVSPQFYDRTGINVCPSPNKKDVYVELDYMQGQQPSLGAIANVVQAFANSPNGGIQLHVQIDEQTTPYFATFFSNTQGAGNIYDPNFFQLKQQYFGTISDRTCPPSVPNGACSQYISDLLAAKQQVFHYNLWIHAQLDDSGFLTRASGRSNTDGTIPGNGFVVSLGLWNNGAGGNGDQQAGTFMHELGHNLGLQHGGNEYINCKPNYFSVMNYLYQMSTNLVPNVHDRPLDYSESVVSSINESNISDNAGIGQSVPPNRQALVPGLNLTSLKSLPLVNTTAGKSPFDWDRNQGIIDAGPYVLDVHNNDTAGCGNDPIAGPQKALVLNGFNDWFNLKYNFRSSGVFQNGLSVPLTRANIEINETQAEVIRKAIGAPPGIIDPTTILPIINYVVDSGNNRTETFNATGTFLSSFGSSGTGNGQFNKPSGIAIDNAYKAYIADSGNNRIEKFNSSGTFLLSFGSSGTGNGQFKVPTGIAVNTGGNVYVADSGNNRIEEFNSTGGFITSFGSYGTGNGQFIAPTGVAIEDPGHNGLLIPNVYVTDSGNNRIEKFNSSGSFLLSFGSYGSGNGQFKAPTGVAVDNSGIVYVADSGNNRIQEFNSTGAFIKSFGSFGTGNGKFIAPTGIAVDLLGNVYVVDSGNNRIEKFNSSGTFLLSFGSSGIGNGQFNAPTGVAVNRFIP